MDVLIRTAREEDAEALLNIYAYYVLHTAVTFEYEVPTIEEFRNRIKTTLQNYPYYVAITEGRIVGYIYAGRLGTRAAYAWSAITSIYIDRQFHGMGIGKKLYAELEKTLAKQHVVNVYARVADPIEEDEYLTHNSEHFHKAIGYEISGRWHKCGNKFGRWYNLIEMEKFIGEHICPPEVFIPYEKLEK